jgi:hypothetical protein
VYPKTWGDLVPRTGKEESPTDSDFEALAEMRDEFRAEYYLKPIQHKIIKKFLVQRGYEPLLTIRRLWKGGYIGKFSTETHTISGRLQYFNLYIWEDWQVGPYKKSVPQFI